MKYQYNIDPRIVLSEDEIDAPVFVKFTGDFTEEAASAFRSELNAAESHARAAKQDIIPIIIDSFGGDVYSLLSVIDAIDSCEIPVATIVEGKAMSAGAVLFSCGKEGHRYISPNATVMIHGVSSFARGKTEDMKVSLTEMERLQKVLFERVSLNLGHDRDWLEEQMVKKRHLDWYLDSEESKKINLANHIGVPVVKVDITMNHSFGLPATSPAAASSKRR